MNSPENKYVIVYGATTTELSARVCRMPEGCPYP